jgi:hypothetical protein
VLLRLLIHKHTLHLLFMSFIVTARASHSRTPECFFIIKGQALEFISCNGLKDILVDESRVAALFFDVKHEVFVGRVVGLEDGH